MKFLGKSILILSLLMAMLLVGCGGEEEGAGQLEGEGETAVQSDAGEETAVSSDDDQADEGQSEEGDATSEPEISAVALTDEVRVEEGGFAFQPPDGYQVDVDFVFAELAAPDADETGPIITLSGTPFTEEQSVQSMFDSFVADFEGDETITIGEPENVAIGDYEGVAASLEGDEEGTPIEGRLLVLGNEQQGVFMFGGAAADRWNEEIGDTFDAIANTITLFEPALDSEEPATEEETEDADTADDETAAADAEETDDADAADTETGEEETGEEETDETEAATPTATGNTDPGFACFGSENQGVTCLSAEGAWQVFNQDNSDLGGDLISDINACQDGTLLIAHINGVSIYDGEGFTNLADDWGSGSAEGVACDSDGGIWVAHYQGVSNFDGSSWTTYEAANLATGEQASDLVYDIAVDASGQVWAVTPNTIAAFDGSEWTRYQVGEGLDDLYFFDQLLLDSSGSVYALHSNGLLKFDGEAWAPQPEGDFFSAESAVVDANGGQWVGTFSNGLHHFNGSGWEVFDMTNSDLSSNGVRSLALDNNGRLYIGSVYGLNITDGDAWTVYNMDSADMANHKITNIGVVNGGPTLPEPQDKENGSVTGVIDVDGEPLADAAMELCVRELYSSFTGDTPCADQALYFTTTTDADGAFTFEDVPVGIYFIVFDTGDGWGKLTDEFGIGSAEIPVLAGETTELGQLSMSFEE